jgi:omega-6 fatty acid desaturase (delta-12 desaturase)
MLVGLHVGIILLLGYKAFLMVHLPILLFFAVIAIWFFYVQHQHETSYKAWKDQWDYIRAAVQGSTFYTLPKIFHWLTGNIGYHHIHHLNPLVPNYQLARCHKENPILDQVANKIGFIESLRCMFNKLWDEEQERMITYREYFRKYRTKK